MQSILSSLATIALSLIVSMGLLPSSVPQKMVGSAVPSTPALIDTYLAANMSAADTSMTLANGTTNDGTALSGYMCFTIDANMPTVEYVCGTASSTSVTGLTRGIDLTNPNATTTRVYAHRRFASVQTTDYPTLQFIVRKLNGVDTFDSVLSYTSTTPSNFTSSQDLASKGYVDNQIVSGGVPITTSTPGIGLLATPAQTAAGTATGTYNAQTYNLIPANSLFNQTSSATTLVPLTGSNGKLSDGFIDHTASYTNSGNITSTGLNVFTATTTLSTATVNGIDIASNLIKFGGNGTDGALNISSGTTTIDLGGASFFVKNYTSISITGTSSLAFINPNANGTIIALRSLGNVVITSTASPTISLVGLGSGGGTGATGGSCTSGNASGGGAGGGSAFNSGTSPSTMTCSLGALSWGGGSASFLWNGSLVNGVTAGSGSTQPIAGRGIFSTSSLSYLTSLDAPIIPGGGGGGGGSWGSGYIGGAGGAGGGSLQIQCAGNLNFTGSINAGGSNGLAGSGGGSGGGGGGGGTVQILYHTATATSGTVIVNGGSGGAGGQTGGTGGAGYYILSIH